MPSFPGDFIWYDVMTPDPAAGRTFYKAVLGWNIKDSGVPGQDYTLMGVGETMVAGLMNLPDDVKAMGVPPCWTGYIGSADVDADVVRVTGAGGSIRKPPQDIPSVGRFAVVADPHGAVFILFTPASAMPPASNIQPDAPGTVGWRELMAGDLAAEFPFYATMFGWTKAEAMDMGPMGVYQLFAKDGVTRGGMMTKMAQMPAPVLGFLLQHGRDRCGRDPRDRGRRHHRQRPDAGARRAMDRPMPGPAGCAFRDGRAGPVEGTYQGMVASR